MIRDLSKIVSLILSIWSVHVMIATAFFVPASGWQDRLWGTLEAVGLATCICFAGGLVFSIADKSATPVIRTLPVQLFFWFLGGLVLLFLVAAYLEEYYVPLLWRNQPH